MSDAKPGGSQSSWPYCTAETKISTPPPGACGVLVCDREVHDDEMHYDNTDGVWWRHEVTDAY